MKLTLTTGLILLVFVNALQAGAGEPAGSIKTLAGDVSVVRGDQTLTAGLRDELYQGDELVTGTEGSVGVIFRDNSTLSLGPGSNLVIDEFVFAPAEGKLGMVTRMLKGTAVFLSGEITKLAPGAARVETPLATIGFRGTRFAVSVD